jgi:hypothetical protein
VLENKTTKEKNPNNFRLLRELNVRDTIFIYLIASDYQIQ